MTPTPSSLQIRIGLLLVGASLLAACGTSATKGTGSATTTASPSSAVPTTVDGLTVPTPSPAAADFTTSIDNQWFPLKPGTRWTYSSVEGKDRATEVVTVTNQTRVVAGVTCVVVTDVVTGADGTLQEKTFDWYAQDRAGNVWYFGEDTTAYDGGKSSTRGSWEAGKDGGQPGIQMLASPDLGDSYAQEYSAGTAEDHGEVIALGGRRVVPAGTYDGVLITKDTTPLEPDVVEHKIYARGVGTVAEQDISGGAEVVRLLSVTRP